MEAASTDFEKSGSPHLSTTCAAPPCLSLTSITKNPSQKTTLNSHSEDKTVQSISKFANPKHKYKRKLHTFNESKNVKSQSPEWRAAWAIHLRRAWHRLRIEKVRPWRIYEELKVGGVSGFSGGGWLMFVLS